MTWSGARSSILVSIGLAKLMPLPTVGHPANADLFVTLDFCLLMVAMVAQWIGIESQGMSDGIQLAGTAKWSADGVGVGQRTVQQQ